MTPAVARGIVDGIEKGILRNTGMFMNMPWAREEARKNMDFPDLSPDESAEIDGIISEQEESDEPSEEDFKEAFESEEADETEEADGIQPDSADDAATVEPNADEESGENELAASVRRR